jgi:hypothetical protein
MGKWDIIIKDEFDGHLVMVEVRRSDFETDNSQGGHPGVRVTITCLRDCDDTDIAASEQTSTATDAPAGALITLEPDTLDELEGDLIEVGFSTEAAARIVSRVPHRNEARPVPMS